MGPRDAGPQPDAIVEERCTFEGDEIEIIDDEDDDELTIRHRTERGCLVFDTRLLIDYLLDPELATDVCNRCESATSVYTFIPRVLVGSEELEMVEAIGFRGQNSGATHLACPDVWAVFDPICLENLCESEPLAQESRTLSPGSTLSFHARVPGWRGFRLDARYVPREFVDPYDQYCRAETRWLIVPADHPEPRIDYSEPLELFYSLPTEAPRSGPDAVRACVAEGYGLPLGCAWATADDGRPMESPVVSPGFDLPDRWVARFSENQ